MNPYAAPKAKLEEVLPAGRVWRDGNFVRMDLGAALPDRCVACNGEAAKRISRTLYWSPLAWRLFSVISPFALVWAGVALEMPLLAVLFWPAVIIMLIAHYFVRRKLAVEIAVCARHRRLRAVLQALSLATLGGIVLIFMNLSPEVWTLLVAAVAALIALAIVQSFVGVQAVSLKKLDGEHAWLGGTGRTFREALPELPGA